MDGVMTSELDATSAEARSPRLVIRAGRGRTGGSTGLDLIIRICSTRCEDGGPL